MLQRIALLAIAAALSVMLAAGIFGVPVANSLSSSGFQDPSSESARATQLLTDKFGQGDLQMLITVTAPDSATGPAARTVGLSIVDQLRRAPNVAGVRSAWSASPAAAKDLVSKDGRTGLIVAGLSGGESVAQKFRPDGLRRGGARSPGRGDWRDRPVPRIAADDDRILGFRDARCPGREVMAAVQTAMIADLPYPRLRDAVLAHPTMGRGTG